MKLSITVTQTRPGLVTVSPAGPIDSETYRLLNKEIDKVLAQPVKTLVLDMAGVGFITSSGIGTITKAKTSLTRKGGDLAMINLQPQVKKAFEIVRLLPILNVFENIQELDEYLGKLQRRITGEDEEF